jgi:CRISPR-associated protein Cmr6
LDAACALNETDGAALRALANRQRRLTEPLEKSGAALVLDAIAVAPFTTGLGNEHPLENGFAFLSPYGLPYLPGIGVKGVVRQAAGELASGEWGDTGGWNSAESYPLEIGERTICLSLTDVLFGREAPPGEREHVRGALTFWDVFPQIEGDRLLVEVMTAHQSHYYQRDDTPHDSGSPVPINFLTIPPNSRFVFPVLCSLPHLRRLAPPLAAGDRWRDLVGAAFRHAFEWLGFGAKTAVGYGALKSAAPPGGGSNRPAQRPTPETTQPPAPERASETWQSARLQYNARNGTLTAIAENRARANAFEARAQELLRRLPDEVRGRVLANQFVRVTARVHNSELIDIKVKS